jgi:hypothetical protein
MSTTVQRAAETKHHSQIRAMTANGGVPLAPRRRKSSNIYQATIKAYKWPMSM